MIQVGTMVQVRIDGTDEEPVLRPGFVLAVHSPTSLRLHILMNLWDDELAGQLPDYGGGIQWIATLDQGTAVAQWRLPS